MTYTRRSRAQIAAVDELRERLLEAMEDKEESARVREEGGREREREREKREERES